MVSSSCSKAGQSPCLVSSVKVDACTCQQGRFRAREHSPMHVRVGNSSGHQGRGGRGGPRQSSTLWYVKAIHSRWQS